MIRELRDGPLENLWGWGGAGEVQKKYSRKGKLNEQNSCTLILPSKIFMLWPKKNSYKEFDNEQNSCRSKIPPPPITFLIVRLLSKDVFGRHTSTGSESFSLLICLDANKFVFLRIFSLTESICLNIWSKSRPKIGKKSTSGWRASLKKIVFQTPYFWTPIRFGMVHVDKEHL